MPNPRARVKEIGILSCTLSSPSTTASKGCNGQKNICTLSPERVQEPQTPLHPFHAVQHTRKKGAGISAHSGRQA